MLILTALLLLLRPFFGSITSVFGGSFAILLLLHQKLVIEADMFGVENEFLLDGRKAWKLDSCDRERKD